MIDGRAVIFTDVSQSAWFASYVRDAAEAGIVNGYMDARGRLTGKLGPSNSITFAEAIKIAAEGAGYDEALYGSSVQSGVGQHWSSPYVAVAKAEHFAVMQEHFRLDQPATRAQVASMFTSAFGVKTTDIGPVDSRYTDVKVSTQYAASIEALSRDGILSGDTDTRGEATGTFRPMVPINRAEVVKMVIEARAKYGQPGRNKRPSEASAEATVTYDNEGFSPDVLRIKKGTAVSFHNTSGDDLWVASNPHPTHTGYLNFDAKEAMGSGEMYIFTFNRIGTFSYHNHLSPSKQGTIIVEE